MESEKIVPTTKIICLTPMKNESWIIERFVKCASLWADNIIILDQNSTDNSAELCKQFEKVKVLTNNGENFNDFNHWNILLNEGRKIEAERRIFIAIDCDEFITANSFETLEWKNFVNNAPEGSLMVMNRIMVRSNFTQYAKEPDFLIGFVDDGTSSINDLSVKKNIHNIRLPFPKEPNLIFRLNQCKLMHYNLVDFYRFKSKMRWYQCYEKILNDKNLLDILIQYQVTNTENEFWEEKSNHDLPNVYFLSYQANGIDMTTVQTPANQVFYWDEIVANYFRTHGTEFFGKMPIWDYNWHSIDSSLVLKRKFMDKIFTRLLLKAFRSKKSSSRKMLLSILSKW